MGCELVERRATYYLLPTTYYLLPTTYRLPPTTCYLLPTTGYYLLLATTYYWLLPTTGYFLLLATSYSHTWAASWSSPSEVGTLLMTLRRRKPACATRGMHAYASV